LLDLRFSHRAENVVQTLQQICATTGYPKTIRVDQGSEFISRDLDLWAFVNGVALDFSRPGKSTDNAFVEAFNGRFRAERPLVPNLDDSTTRSARTGRGERPSIATLNRYRAASPPS